MRISRRRNSTKRFAVNDGLRLWLGYAPRSIYELFSVVPRSDTRTCWTMELELTLLEYHRLDQRRLPQLHKVVILSIEAIFGERVETGN